VRHSKLEWLNFGKTVLPSMRLFSGSIEINVPCFIVISWYIIIFLSGNFHGVMGISSAGSF